MSLLPANISILRDLTCYVCDPRRRGEAELNGTAVLEAIFLPASKAGQYPRIASSGEVTAEWEQPGLCGAVPLQDGDLSPCSFAVAAEGQPCCWPAACLGGPHICPLSQLLLLPEPHGVAFAALQSITLHGRWAGGGVGPRT